MLLLSWNQRADASPATRTRHDLESSISEPRSFRHADEAEAFASRGVVRHKAFALICHT